MGGLWDGIIRMAKDDDGPAIGKLFAETGLDDLEVDWTISKVGGWWLVGERDGNIMGAIQLSLGSPFGIIGDIVITPSEQGRREQGGSLAPGGLATTLYAWAFELIRKNNGQIALGVTNQEKMRTLLRRYGVDLGEFTMFAKRVA